MPGVGRSYTTAFPLTENPISEGGNWINGQTDGLDWHDMSTTPGLAIGHQSGSSYTDGTALLTGSWGPNQTVEAVVHAVNPKDSCYQEVELRLRSTLTPRSCTGYEISFKATKTSGAYLIIVRWNGPLGDFSYLVNTSGAQYGVTEGDVVKATIVGNVITAYLNGVAGRHRDRRNLRDGKSRHGNESRDGRRLLRRDQRRLRLHALHRDGQLSRDGARSARARVQASAAQVISADTEASRCRPWLRFRPGVRHDGVDERSHATIAAHAQEAAVQRRSPAGSRPVRRIQDHPQG